MIPYTSARPSRKNQAELRAAGWRLLLTPQHRQLAADFRFAIDNGTFSAGGFQAEKFAKLVETLGAAADFIVLPDIIAGGNASLELSVSWIPKLKGLRKLLLPIQDGMNAHDVGMVLRQNVQVGLFLGGTTRFKLEQIYSWGMVAAAWKRHYHVGRVNTAKRVRLCAEAGADSFDGTGAARYGRLKTDILERQIRQPNLLAPEAAAL